MRKIIFTEYGNPTQTLKIENTDKPTLTADDALIKVIASPINPSDVMFVQNLYGIRPQLPSAAGFEGVGIVAEVGENVKMPIGTRVAFTGMGAWADYAVANHRVLVPVPDMMPDEVAAQLFVNPFTAVSMVEESGVKEGEWLMITACGSALGKMVIQLCKMKGIKVVGTVRRNDLNEELTRIGADAIVNTETDNLPAAIKQLTEGKGVRAVLECVGGSTTEEAIKCLGRGGVMLIYGLMSLSNPTLDIGLMIFKELNIKGFWLTDWMRRVDNNTRMKVAQEVITLLATGQIKMPVEATYSLEQISEAMAHTQATGRWGKILIKP